MDKGMLLAIVLLLAGAGYGYLSALENVNPHRNDALAVDITDAELAAFEAWRPSPVYLPSYLVATVPQYDYHPRNPQNDPHIPESVRVVGFGLLNRGGLGYRFETTGGKSQYTFASIGVGSLMGLVLAGVLGLATGWITLGRRKGDRSQPQ